MQFFGTYTHRIDAKGRLALPSKFRKAFEREQAVNNAQAVDLVVTTSPSKYDDKLHECLYVFTLQDFDTWVKSFFDVVGGYNPRNKKHEMQMWALHANVEEVKIDASGRINIPQKFREKAGLDTDVAIVGNSGHFEIWDDKRMQNKLDEIDLEELIYDKQ